MHTNNVHSGIIHNNLKMETTKCPTDEQVKCGIFGNKKEEIASTVCDMDEPWKMLSKNQSQ